MNKHIHYYPNKTKDLKYSTELNSSYSNPHKHTYIIYVHNNIMNVCINIHTI